MQFKDLLNRKLYWRELEKELAGIEEGKSLKDTEKTETEKL